VQALRRCRKQSTADVATQIVWIHDDSENAATLLAIPADGDKTSQRSIGHRYKVMLGL
jgi:hypothetical protein